MQAQSEIPSNIQCVKKPGPDGFLVKLLKAYTRQLIVNDSKELKVVKNIAQMIEKPQKAVFVNPWKNMPLQPTCENTQHSS